MTKIGRNDPCPCGSGKKYKKCCNSARLESRIKHSTSNLVDAYKESNLGEATIIESSSVGALKMSEVILAFADDLLSQASTRQAKENAILIAILAWNIALVDTEEDKMKLMNEFLSSFGIESPEEAREIAEIIEELVHKKKEEYPHIKRPILGHDCIHVEDGLHLNVMSPIM